MVNLTKAAFHGEWNYVIDKNCLGDCRRFSYRNAPDSAPYARRVNPHVVALRKGWRNAADGVEGKQAGMKMDSSGLAMPRILAGGNPVRVTASHGPGIEPCSQSGNGLVDA